MPQLREGSRAACIYVPRTRERCGDDVLADSPADISGNYRYPTPSMAAGSGLG